MDGRKPSIPLMCFNHPAGPTPFSYMSFSSSSSLACPIVWGRRYSCLSSSSISFGLHLLLFPGMSTSSILLTMCSSFILLTWPYHFSRFSVIFLDACTNPVVPLMCSFRILSLLVTPHIHLILLVVLLVLSLLPRTLYHTTELV